MNDLITIMVKIHSDFFSRRWTLYEVLNRAETFCTYLIGSVKVSGKLPTYPSPNPTLILTSHFGQNVGLGEGWVGSFPETLNDSLYLSRSLLMWYDHLSEVCNWLPVFFGLITSRSVDITWPFVNIRVYQTLLKTESLDNTILELWLASPSWYMSHYTMVSKCGNCRRLVKIKNKLKIGCFSRDFVGLFFDKTIIHSRLLDMRYVKCRLLFLELNS